MSLATAPFDPGEFVLRHRLTAARNLRVEMLSGGYLNAVYRVRGPELDWVVKRFVPAADLYLFPNLPDAEHLALQRAAKAGVAPRPIAFLDDDPAGPVLIYEYYAGRPWDGGMAAVATLLRRIGDVPVDGFRETPIQPSDILLQGDTFLPACSPTLAVRLAAMRPSSITMPAIQRRLIHTDFGPGNLIDGAEGLKAIDWQCPAAGDPAEDLAAFISPAFQILYGRAPLSALDEAALLAAYDDRAVIERLHLIRPFYDWRMASYCAMRIEQFAATRPEAARSYRRATEALLTRLQARA